MSQTWTERAKGQPGDATAADLKKRKRAGGGAEEDGYAVAPGAHESGAKKKKAVDPSSKLAAFAFGKD